MSPKTDDRLANVGDLERRLEILEAEAAIRRLIADHQWVNDSGSSGGRIPDWSSSSPIELDAAGGRNTYWAKGGSWQGSGLSSKFEGFTHAAVGPDAQQSFTNQESLASWLPRTIHFLTNESIQIESSTKARGRWYVWEAATVRLGEVLKAILIAARYECDFVKENTQWKIKSMHFQEVFSTPFESSGWTETAHVAYGPGNVVAARNP